MFSARCVRFISRIESECSDWLGPHLLGPLLLFPILKGDGNYAPLGLCLSHGAYTCFSIVLVPFVSFFCFNARFFLSLDGVNDQNGRVCTYLEHCCCRPCRTETATRPLEVRALAWGLLPVFR